MEEGEIIMETMPMMPPEEFWWNHLSIDQQEFIRNEFTASLFLLHHTVADTNEKEFVRIAYQHSHIWPHLSGWPPTVFNSNSFQRSLF